MSRTDQRGTLEYNSEASWCPVSSTYAKRLATLGPLDFTGLVQNKTDAARTVQYANDGTMPIRGVKEGEFTFDIWLPGHGSATTGAVTLEEHEDVLGAIFGNAATGGSGGTATGGTATVPTTAAESLIVGQIGFFGTKGDGGGDGQAGVVGTDGAGSLTLLSALPAGMTNGHVIYGAAQIYPTETPVTLAITSYRFRGLSTNQQYAIRGCWPKSAKISGLGNGGIPRLSTTWGVSDWDPVSATFPSATAIDAFNPAPCAGGSIVIENVGTTTRTTYNIRDLEVNIGLNTIPVMSPGGVGASQVVTGAVRGPMDITVSFVVDAGNVSATPTWPGFWDSDSQFYQLLYTWNGAANGKQGALYFPKLCIVDKKPVQMSMDGINRERVTMRAYTGGTTTSELTMSAFRLALG